MKESSLKLAKKVTVSEITNKISSAKAIAFAEYRGLTVAQLKEMRVEAKKVGVELKVYKNRLFKLATDKLGYDLSSFLVGANIFAFSNDDDMSAAKLLVKFAKKHKEFVVLKAGTFEGKVVDTQELKKSGSSSKLRRGTYHSCSFTYGTFTTTFTRTKTS